jgi:regulatory protein
LEITLNFRKHSLRLVTTEPPSGEQLYETAVRALGRQARSVNEVRMLLQRKRATKAQIEEILHRLKENGYLDDAKFAQYFAQRRLDSDLHGPARVRRDLAAKRLKPEIADEAVKKTFEDVDQTKLLREYIRRKVHLSKPLTKPSTVHSLHQRLLRAGFRSATIIQELRRMLASPLLKGFNAGGLGAGRSNSGADPDAEPPSWNELLDSLSEVSEAPEQEDTLDSKQDPQVDE